MYALPKINFVSFLISLMATLHLRCHAEITLLIKENECTHFPLPSSASARTWCSDVYHPFILIKHIALRDL